ncbi:MAG: glycosyltransferase family 4 protein [Oligoflexales bacterium]|nr:glycosyltransferase family 4 protein [Oligoflexales bacterium]
MEESPRRILHYIGLRGMTGVETFVLALASGQRTLGIDAGITCNPKGREELIRNAQNTGVPLIPFVLGNSKAATGWRRKLNSLILSVLRVTSLVKILREKRIDVIHIHAVGIHGLPAFLAAIFARTSQIVVTHHATLTYFAPMRTKKSDIIFWLERRFANRVVMPYRAAADEMVSAGVPQSRVFVIPYCANLDRFTYRERKPNQSGQFNFLILARMIKGKGHIELIESMKMLVEKHPEAHLTIAGNGECFEEINNLVAKYALQSSITIMGHVALEQVPDLMTRMDVITLPSYMHGETFPISLLEAGGMGLAAIGSRWFGIPDIIVDGKTGIIVEPRDVESLYRAMLRMVENRMETFEMGQCALKRSRNEFSAEVVAKRYLELYAAGG